MIDAVPHSSFVRIERRRITSEEEGWIRDIVSANPNWSDVQLGDLFVVAECTCGCRSVVLEEPENVQNAGLIGHQNLVGTMDLKVRVDAGEDFVSILLYFAEGSLSMLEPSGITFLRRFRAAGLNSGAICGSVSGLARPTPERPAIAGQVL
jgi:hypothetical protein